MIPRFFLVLLLAIFPAFAYAGMLDEINKAGGGDLAAKAAEKTKEAAKAEGNKKIAVQSSLRNSGSFLRREVLTVVAAR